VIGFRAAPYMTMDAVEGPDQTIQRPLVSDDGEAVAALLRRAGTSALGAANTLVEQGKLLAEKGAARVQAEYASNAAPALTAAPVPAPVAVTSGGAAAAPALAPVAEFSYLDASNNPQGPVSRVELDSLLQSGAITPQTNVLKAGGKWTKYGEL
jgi:hypothetical protein